MPPLEILQILKTIYNNKTKHNSRLRFSHGQTLPLDALGRNLNNTHTLGLDSLTEIKQQKNLIYIWRKENPQMHFYLS